MSLKLTCFTLLFLWSTPSHSEAELRVLGPQSKEDISYQYYLGLIELALAQSSPQYLDTELITLDIESGAHGRNLILLSRKSVDLYWAGTNIEREQQFIPIKTPLILGLLGYRVSLIHQDNLSLFQQISQSPDKLKSLVACQGMHWPDSDILEDNGYKVNRVARYDLMFKMLAKKRCDYFPRGLFEAEIEYNTVKEQLPELVLFNDLIIKYDFPIFIFVHKENKALAQQLDYGFSKILANGSMMDYFKNHALTQTLFPLEQWSSKSFLQLNNRYISENTRMSSKPLLLDLTDVKSLPDNFKQTNTCCH